MNKTNAIASGLLVAAGMLTVAGLAVSLYLMIGTGVFHADYYYLPLQDFVAEERQDSMEQLVIDLYNRAQRRSASFCAAVFAAQLVCLLSARWLLSRPSVRPHG